MRKDLSLEDLDDLLERPLVAVLATRRSDGSPLLSPVWHEYRDGAFHVTTSLHDVKVRHVRRDSSVSLLIYEPDPPWRGVEVRGEATVDVEETRDRVRRIAVRYLGERAGTAYVGEGGSGAVLHLVPDEIRAWDFKDEMER